MEKSYVGMTQCFFCHEPKDIVMDTRLRKRFDRLVGVADMNPCQKCKEYMQQGIIMISARDDDIGNQNPYRTGGWAVVSEEVLSKIITPPELLEKILKARFCFVPDTAWKNLRLPLSDYQKQIFRQKRRARREERKKNNLIKS